MELATLAALMLSGFAWGMVHAFDPDHVVAVTGVSSAGHQGRPVWHYALRWSLGHGAAIALIALPVFLLGMAVPNQLSAVAERSVALLLIVIGVISCWRMRRQYSRESQHADGRGAVLVGLIHGTAGSAPLIALLPLSQLSQPVSALAYVLFFCAGVLIAMTSLGGLLSWSMHLCLKFSHTYERTLRVFFALASIVTGVCLLWI